VIDDRVEFETDASERLDELAKPGTRHGDLEVLVLTALATEEEVDRPTGRHVPRRLDFGERAVRLLGTPRVPLVEVGVDVHALKLTRP